MIKRIRSWLESSFTTSQFTYKELRSMYGTLLLDSFFILFIGFLSTAMVSSTGEAALAAANMVGSINALVVLLFMGVAVGGSIVVARAKGSGDAQAIRHALGETICISGVIGIVFSSLLFLLSDTLVTSLYPRAEPLLIDYSIKYMRLMCISFVPYSIFNAIFHSFRSLGDTRSSLVLTVVINVTHLLCSFLFINVMKLGITGAGLSYVVARMIGMLLALFWLLIFHNEYHVEVKHLFRFSKRISREIASLAIPIASESALSQGGMLLVQVYLAYLTTTDLAAHGVANSYLMLFNTTSNALSSLTSTICGQCFGAGHYDLVRQYNKRLVQVGRFIMLATVAVLLPLSPIILQLFSPSEQGLPIIYRCITIAACGLPTIWCDGYITPMTLRASGDASYSTMVSVAALFVGRIGVGYVLTIVLGFGVPGVWLGMMVEWLLRAILMRTRISGSKWLHIPKEKTA